MPRQLVQHFSRLHLPHRHRSVPSADGYPRAIVVFRPGDLDERLLETRWRASQRAVDPHGVGRERSDVVDDQCGVEGVGR